MPQQLKGNSTLHQHSVMGQCATSFHDCDIQKIISNLYIGDEQASRNKKLLQELDIKHVIVVGKQLKLTFSSLFQYLHLEVQDHKKQQINKHFQKTNKFIMEALQKKQTVLVHCRMGKSRSATIIIAYLMYKYNMRFLEALNFMKRKRKQISPNQGFIFQLKKYQQELTNNIKISSQN